MLTTLAQNELLSPTSFSLSVHNAISGLFSIARSDQTSSIAISAGANTVESGVIEACGLLEDGEPQILLIVYDKPLPAIFSSYQEENEHAYAWAWLMEKPKDDTITLSWHDLAEAKENSKQQLSNQSSERLPMGLDIFRFYLQREKKLKRTTHSHHWCWGRND